MFKKPKVKEIVTLLESGTSFSMISSIIGSSRHTVSKINERRLELNVTGKDLQDKTIDEIYDLFFPNKFINKNEFATIDFKYVQEELKRVGVTLYLLWEEYKSECLENGLKPYSYISFTQKYSKYKLNREYTAHIDHRPGEAIEVDWSGPTMSFFDKDSNQKIIVYLFVATLPYSQKTFVIGTTSMNQESWMYANVEMLNYFGGVPVKIICDNLKTGVISHPKAGEIIMNEAYLSFGEYYSVAILPTNVRKPKEKASVEGSVGKIATKIIAKLRNEEFNSLAGINKAIRNALEDFNNAPFQKREGSRNSVFELEEKQHLRKLPIVAFEVCSWAYKIKVNYNSHIVYKNNWYSVPYKFIGSNVDIKSTKDKIYIYYNKELISEHPKFIETVKNRYRTISAHIPEGKVFEQVTKDSLLKQAENIGDYTKLVVNKLFKTEKVENQAIPAVSAILQLTKAYPKQVIEDASKKALDKYIIPRYKNLISIIKENKIQKDDNKQSDKRAFVRGSDYYKGE